MPTNLLEFTTACPSHLRVDRDAGVLKDVKLLGLQSTNGRRYLESALSKAASLYEGAKVNVNHALGGPLVPREYQDRLGVIRSVRVKPNEGLFGDLHFNPKHALAEQLLWDAQHAPQNVGLSHNVTARTSQRDDEVIVEAIEAVNSVDLVADPATTRGLFESARDDLQRSATPAGARWQRIGEMLSEYALPLPGSQSEPARAILNEQFLQSLWAAPDDVAARQLIRERADLIAAASEWHKRQTADHVVESPTSRDQFDPAVADHAAELTLTKAFVEAVSC